VGLLSRAYRVKLRNRAGGRMMDSGSVRGEFERVLRILSVLYGRELALDRTDHARLRAAMVLREAGTAGPLVLGIRPGMANPDAQVYYVRIEDAPVVSPAVQKYLASYPARVFMALQGLNLALAWEELVERGLESEAAMVDLIRLTFDTLDLGTSAAQMYYELSAVRQAGLVRAGALARGVAPGLHRLGSLTSVVRGLGGMAAVLEIGSAVAGLRADLDRIDQADLEKNRLRADLLESSADLNRLGIATGGLMVAAIVAAPVSATAAVVAGVVSLALGIYRSVMSFIVGGEIERHTYGPLELWLKSCYWGTDPYRMNWVKEGHVVLSYAELKEDLQGELEAIGQILYAFRGRLSWTLEGRQEWVSYKEGIPGDTYRPGVVVDVLLPNPGPGRGKVFMRVRASGADHRRGRGAVLWEGQMAVEQNAGGSTELKEGMMLKYIDGQAPAVYERDATGRVPKPAGPGRTLRLEISPRLLPEHAASVSVDMAFAPQGSANLVVPDAATGLSLFVSVYEKKNGVLCEDVQSSLEDFEWTKVVEREDST